MILSASQLRKELKDVCPSLKSFVCEYVECLDEQYLVPSYQESFDLLDQFWQPIKNTPWVHNVGDCDNRAIKLYSDVHWYRVSHLNEIPDDQKIQWSLGFASGNNPFGQIHTFNLIRNDQGWFVFDNIMKSCDDYTPITARF